MRSSIAASILVALALSSTLSSAGDDARANRMAFELTLACARGESVTVRSMLSVPFRYGGVRFSDQPDCAKRFGSRGRLAMRKEVDAFAVCLAAQKNPFIAGTGHSALDKTGKRLSMVEFVPDPRR